MRSEKAELASILENIIGKNICGCGDKWVRLWAVKGSAIFECASCETTWTAVQPVGR